MCYKQSPDNAHSVAFSQRSSSPRLIEGGTFNDSDIINNLINYEDCDIVDCCESPSFDSRSVLWFHQLFKDKYDAFDCCDPTPIDCP
ncbi:hypothetical protein TNCV_154431 [Trichonephila clavipes]|uniref:Uncharacterized protein n=1 Tax=Trichonephila clavipes TaxID=2585209 RepID=A0A8X6WHH9_TRICX|nr:hypothetical protein TNCV_154431 [Trichonephila clavipes]